MRFVVLAIVLGFPFVDFLLTLRLARWTGVPLWVWLAGSGIAGMWVLANERDQFRMRTLAAFRGDPSPLRGLLDSGRRVLAGLLLILPGVLSDVLALLLLSLPINQRGGFGPQPIPAGRSTYPRSGDTVDGDYRRIE
ncbi:MAG TPA: FxsA family protein [Casimicrobiaceae bacterium]|nr:FxsA family protein [Casimicrobiaceae bacterium]